MADVEKIVAELLKRIEAETAPGRMSVEEAEEVYGRLIDDLEIQREGLMSQKEDK